MNAICMNENAASWHAQEYEGLAICCHTCAMCPLLLTQYWTV